MSDRQRLNVFIITVFAVVTVLIVRLFSFSVIKHDDFVDLAAKQQNVERDVTPVRGSVFFQDYAANTVTVAAQSIERYAFSVSPRDITKDGKISEKENVLYKNEYADFLAKTLNIDKDKLLATFSKAAVYVDPIIHDLTKEQVDVITKGLNDINIAKDAKQKPRVLNFDEAQGTTLFFFQGFFFQREYERVYPEGSLLGQVLGFVDDRGKGQYGFEGHYDDALRGYIGRVRMQKDSIGNLLGENGSIEGQDGISYELTVDRNIQRFIEDSLAQEVKDAEAKGGSVIVMDPKTGAILGMASTPSYDPNKFREAANQDISLFDNPAISKQWEPGSIFKPLVMAAAIDQGVVKPETRSVFASSVTVNGYDIHTALNKAYGDESMTDVLVNSDNVAMVWLAAKMGNDMIYDYLVNKYGFGKQTGVDLRNEIGGTVQPVSKWSPIIQATTSFGQGIAVTPLQVLSAYTAIADEGIMKKPHIVKTIIRPDGTREDVTPVDSSQVMKKETASDLLQMLTAVVNKGHRRAGVEGYKIGGKTGTAQVPNPDGPGYIEQAYNHSFVGIGPIDDPKFVILTKVDQPNIAKVGTYAEATAVPLFSKVANFLVHYYQIPPTNR